MKEKLLILLFVLSFTIFTFSFQLSGSYLLELSGYERTFYGTNVILGDKDIIGLEFGVFLPPDTIETGELTYLQPTTFLLAQLPLNNFKFFTGISPIFQYYKSEFSLYSYTMYLTKAGLSLYLGPIVLTGGINTIIDLSFQQTFGIYGVYGELGLRF
ncbi:hypothetical protein OSSY52_16930 [Tepiditoga spiralis]|uniref:Outer membrane protein beta-barrel domain-containing protein n=1 Tax=Tepiditoga spiralis TaxID=2108365 RepID=A0A7G1GB50_9BACT|nr:hypothetical protein [Tepiditoga spiralis]BBE31552.1 hypothetical protein OSSY52_16930 [Tepiditoga spiralis]